MRRLIGQLVTMAAGFVLGAIVAYAVAPSHALACLAVGGAVAGGAIFGLGFDWSPGRTSGGDSAQERAARERRESPEFLQTVIDGIPEVTMVIDRNHRIVLANRLAREMAGGEDPVSKGLACHQVSHHSNVPCEGLKDTCPLAQVVKTREPATVTHTHYGPDNSEILVEVRATPIFDESGEVAEIVEACLTTARK